MRIRPVSSRRLFFVLLAGLLMLPTTVQASSSTANSLRADVTTDPPLVGLFPYGSGTSYSFSSQTDFAAGLLSRTSSTLVPDTLTLERLVPVDPDTALASWWNPNWIVRQCFELDHSVPGAADLTDTRSALLRRWHLFSACERSPRTTAPFSPTE
jgi:hypothetical protein